MLCLLPWTPLVLRTSSSDQLRTVTVSSERPDLARRRSQKPASLARYINCLVLCELVLYVEPSRVLLGSFDYGAVSCRVI